MDRNDEPEMSENENFDGVVQTHWAEILRLCILTLADETEGEEAAQQTFFKAYIAWDSFERRSSVRTWLFRIAINVCRRHLATRKRFQGKLLDLHIERAHPEMDPREAQMTEKVRQAMQQLAPPHQLILTLFCINGMKHQDIAKIFDVPEGTVWSRLHKAKQELRKEFQAIED